MVRRVTEGSKASKASFVKGTTSSSLSLTARDELCSADTPSRVLWDTVWKALGSEMAAREGRSSERRDMRVLESATDCT